MAIEIILHGVKMTVTKDQLFELAANGGITKDTPVNVSGKMVAAKKIKGLVFREEKEVVPNTSPSPKPVVSSPASTSRLSKGRCINVGITLMLLSVLFGFIVGFIAAANDFWELLWVLGPLEGVGFFVGFAMFIFGVSLVEEDTVNPVQTDQRHKIPANEHYRQALAFYQSEQYDKVLEMAHSSDQSDFCPEFHVLCAIIWNERPDSDEKKQNEIIRHCSSAIKKGTVDNDLYFLRGQALMKLTMKGFANYHEAIEDFNRIPKSDKNYRQARNDLNALKEWQEKKRARMFAIFISVTIFVILLLVFAAR